MVQSQFSLSWDSYKSNICDGFGSLQQNGEFVDMTLAADGHFVKVHQVLMALASSYIKDLLTSAPCQHPVIFLNNVSYKSLTSLLEYVYTGEVLVQSDNLSAFIQAAKSLHIKGLEDLNNTSDSTYRVVDDLPNIEDISCHISGIKTVGMPDGSSGQIVLPAAAKKVFITQQKQMQSSNNQQKQSTNISMDTSGNTDYGDMIDDNNLQDSDDGFEVPTSKIEMTTIDPKAATANLQFSMSIRGSMQVILNRYIYNLHSTKHRNGIRRWRCVDYRNNRCKAFVVTKGNIVLNRANLHNHSFHDKKILQKIEKKAVFSALDDVQVYKEEQENAENNASENAAMDAITSAITFVRE